MISVTALLTWPVHRDYPLFRYRMRSFHEYFKDVFIAFTNENQPINYMGWIVTNMPYAQPTKPMYSKPDWRNDTVNTLLTLDTHTDYYLFMEQDFLIKKEEFFRRIFDMNEDFIYYEEGGRIHPAFALIKRELVNKTSLDFSAYPDEGKDHFGRFFDEIKSLCPGKELRTLGFEEQKDFYHMAGLTQNYACAERGEPFYKPEEFLHYNFLSMVLPYQNPQFYMKQYEIAEKYGYTERETFLDSFFPTTHEI